jgi:hypothetical protein
LSGSNTGNPIAMHRVLVSYVLEVPGDVSVRKLQDAVYATSNDFVRIIDTGTRLGEAPVVINADGDPFNEEQAAHRRRTLFSRRA